MMMTIQSIRRFDIAAAGYDARGDVRLHAAIMPTPLLPFSPHADCHAATMLL